MAQHQYKRSAGHGEDKEMDEKTGVEALLSQLEKAFERTRKPVVALYPYDKETQSISLPTELDEELRQLVVQGQKPKAVKWVTEWTGAGLRLAKDYVDGLIDRRPRG